MATLTLLQAVTDGLRTAMKNDPSVLVFGEDVGKKGGVFLATEKLQEEFGLPCDALLVDLQRFLRGVKPRHHTGF